MKHTADTEEERPTFGSFTELPPFFPLLKGRVFTTS
jgi:hypothetical protein